MAMVERLPTISRLLSQAALETIVEGTATRRTAVRFDRNERIDSARSGRCAPLYVVVLRIERCYGGPQEGGWWYDWHTVEEVRRAWGFRTLLATVRELRRDYASHRPNRYSMIGGPDYELHVTPREGDIETLESRERPTYC
jgi:hypothetical protein